MYARTYTTYIYNYIIYSLGIAKVTGVILTCDPVALMPLDHQCTVMWNVSMYTCPISVHT